MTFDSERDLRRSGRGWSTEGLAGAVGRGISNNDPAVGSATFTWSARPTQSYSGALPAPTTPSNRLSAGGARSYRWPPGASE